MKLDSTIEITPLVDLLNDMYEEDFFVVNSEYNNIVIINLYVIIEEVPVLVQNYSKNYKDISYKDSARDLKEFDKELFNNVVNSYKTDYFCTFADIKQSLTLK